MPCFQLLGAFLLLTSLQPLAAQQKLLPVFHFKRVSMAEGLPTDAIRSRVVRDHNGFVWIGTLNGLARYDGYTFKDYRNVPGDPYSLSSNIIMSLLQDRENRLWVGTSESGLSLYDPVRDRFFNFVRTSDDSTAFRPRYIHAILEDRSGDFWLATESEGVAHFKMPIPGDSGLLDSLLHTVRFESYSLRTPRNTAFDLCQRRDGAIVVASDSGVIVVDPTHHSLTRPHLSGPFVAHLGSDNVYCAFLDSHDNTWAGTGTDGVFRIEWDRGIVENYRHRKGDSLSIRSDNVWDIVEDLRGNMWLATVEGVDLFSPERRQRMPFLVYGTLPPGSIRKRLSIDNTGTLWIGMNQDGLYRLSRKSFRFPHYSLPERDGGLKSFETIEHEVGAKYWLSFDGKIYQIDISTLEVTRVIDVYRGKKQVYHNPCRTESYLDGMGNYWLGSSGLGLFKVDLATSRITNYGYPNPAGKLCIAWSIAAGPGDSLWTAAYYDGLMKLDPRSGKFQKVPIPLVQNILNDRDGRMWIATETEGLVVYDPSTGQMERFSHDPAAPRSLSHNRTNTIYQDSSGRIWVSAGNMINLWDPATRSFTRYSSPSFEGEITITPIGTDPRGRLWVEHDGLSILDPSSGVFTDFDASDGVCNGPIDMECLSDGRVLLAGWTGVNIVNPDSIESTRPAPPLTLTRMSINDVPVILPSLMNGSGELELSHEKNVLEFGFAATDIDAPGLVVYRYRLAGLENDWVIPKGSRYVRYPGLSPGNYVFRVRAASSRSEWPEQEIKLMLRISPPWWRTNLAYAAYVILLVGVLYGGFRIRLRQIQLRQEVKMKSFQAEHLMEVDRLKSRFFANISHEFRTPLTLILGPLEKLRAKLPDKETAHTYVVMERNARQLLRLINQLLDLSRLESGAMRLQAARSDIVPVVKGIAYSFQSSAGLRHIELSVSARSDEIPVYFDRDKLEKILVNLISNAFKFTREGGRVDVTVGLGPASAVSSSESENGKAGDYVEISVSDTGIGIPAEELPRVFDRFYQVDSSQTREHEGSGIGLALVKELVELHHGEIGVQSTVGEGSAFTLRLPLGRNHLENGEIVEALQPGDIEKERHDVPATDGSDEVAEKAGNHDTLDQRPIVLLVEDNADIIAYVRDYLHEYHIMEARDGIEGTDAAREAIPDLIISDIMMPNRDGYELCRILKNDERTSHIPIILLTAKATSEHKIEGLESGADAYLVKPFEPRELIARVKNLIDLRMKLREHFDVRLRPGEVEVASMENAFLKKLVSTVERRMGDEHFDVEELAGELSMSRMQLHRKVKALTNQPASEFIRYMRLHRAMDLLRSNSGTVSEIAYSVGFSDPSHFAKRFQLLFGFPPSEARKTSPLE